MRCGTSFALLVGILVVCAAQPAQAGFWDSVKDVFDGAWQKTKDVFTGAKDVVECKVVDLTTFSMQPCFDAPDTQLCTAACSTQLEKLPDACLERLASDVVAQGNTNVTTRLEDQLTACGYANLTAFDATSAAWHYGGRIAVLVPVAVLGASVALLGLLQP